MKILDRKLAEERYSTWKDFFTATTSIHNLRAPLEDLRLLVWYITELRQEVKQASFHLPSAAVGSGLTVLLIALLLGIFGFIS